MKKIIYSFIILSSLLLTSCKRDEAPFDGPDLNDLYGPFGLLESFTPALDSVDFSTSQVEYFTARFTKLTDWKITVTGLSSGGTKEIIGKSKTIDISNSTWNGNTTIFPMFKSEKCAVMLTFSTEADTIRDTIKVIKPKINAGYLVTDFESGWKAQWNKFVQSGASMDFNIKNTESIPQENFYYNMAGTVTWDWAIGYAEFTAAANSVTHFPLSTNPNSVYFNILVWGEPGISNAFLQLAFREDDNNNGAFNSSFDDELIYEIKNINWEGWKLVSIKYSDIPLTSPKGNAQYNPDKLVNIRAFLLADPSSGFSKTKIDYLIFTDNKVLEP